MNPLIELRKAASLFLVALVVLAAFGLSTIVQAQQMPSPTSIRTPDHTSTPRPHVLTGPTLFGPEEKWADGAYYGLWPKAGGGDEIGIFFADVTEDSNFANPDAAKRTSKRCYL